MKHDSLDNLLDQEEYTKSFEEFQNSHKDIRGIIKIENDDWLRNAIIVVVDETKFTPHSIPPIWNTLFIDVITAQKTLKSYAKTLDLLIKNKTKCEFFFKEETEVHIYTLSKKIERLQRDLDNYNKFFSKLIRYFKRITKSKFKTIYKSNSY